MPASGCGLVAILGVRALLRLGIPARIVAGKSLSPKLAAADNGHTLLEAHLNGRWQAYDLGFNRQPLDGEGRGVAIDALARLVRQRRPLRFRWLAHDSNRVDWTGYPGDADDFARDRRELAAGPPAFWRTYLQVPLIWTPAGFVYSGDAKVRRYISARWQYRFLPAPEYGEAVGGPEDYDPSVVRW